MAALQAEPAAAGVGRQMSWDHPTECAPGINHREKNMSEEINRPRRRFFGTAGMALAGAQFAFNGAAEAAKAKSAGLRPVKPGTNCCSDCVTKTESWASPGASCRT